MFFHQAKLDAEPTEAFQGQQVLGVLSRVSSLANKGEQFCVVLIHQRRHMTQTVVEHVGFRRELRVRAMPYELRDREATLAM